MKELEKTLKVLANRRRLAILKYLKTNKEAAVGDIASEIRLSFKATSKHLGILSARDVVEKDQKSSQVFYRLADNKERAVNYIIGLL